MRTHLAGVVTASVLALVVGACGGGPTTRDESNPPQSATPPRSKGCEDVPKAADLKKLLQDAPSQNGDAGGVNHGKAMWGAVVDRDGELCALAVSTDDMAATRSRSLAVRSAHAAASRRATPGRPSEIAMIAGIAVGSTPSAARRVASSSSVIDSTSIAIAAP